MISGRSTNLTCTGTGNGSVSETNLRNLAGWFEIERNAGRQVPIDPRYVM